MARNELPEGLVDRALLEASDSYLSLTDIVWFISERGGESSTPEIRRLTGIGLVAELVFSGLVTVINFETGSMTAAADDSTLRELWATWPTEMNDDPATSPQVEFSLTERGWERAIVVGEQDGAWRYVWDGPKYTSKGRWKRVQPE